MLYEVITVEGVWVSERFPHPEVWWSWGNGQKAYEMMSCYDRITSYNVCYTKLLRFHTRFHVFLHPGNALKPNQVYTARGIGKGGNKPLFIFLSFFPESGDSPTQLNMGLRTVDLRNGIDLAAVDIPEGIVLKQIV